MIMSTLGLDNIAVAFALGPLQLGPRRTLQLGLAFGIAEAGMTLLGSALGQAWLPAAMTTEMARAGVLATLGVAVLGLVWVKTRPADFVANAWTLAGLALLLGVDNLVAGTAPEYGRCFVLADRGQWRAGGSAHRRGLCGRRRGVSPGAAMGRGCLGPDVVGACGSRDQLSDGLFRPRRHGHRSVRGSGIVPADRGIRSRRSGFSHQRCVCR